MTAAKMIAFIEKLLDKTKKGKIKWSRFSISMSRDTWASNSKSFSCSAGGMYIVLLCDEELENMLLRITYDDSLPNTELDIEEQPEEVRQVVKRLANYVYNLFPNLEKSIDEFLAEP